MSNISNLAHVHKDAIIGPNVTIEPFAFIDNNVEIGEGTLVMSGAQVRSGARIGKFCTLFPSSVVSGIPQDLKYKGEDTLAIIGDHTTVRECATINKGTAAKGKTIVGSHCLLMACSHVAHDCFLEDHVILGNGTLLAGEVEVGSYAIMSGGSLIHQFSRIGDHVMIQGGTRLSKDIPPYIIAGREPVSFAGVNTIGLRRHGYTNERINQIQDIYRIIYQSGYNFTDAIAFVENNYEQDEFTTNIVSFIKASKRGIVRGFLQ